MNFAQMSRSLSSFLFMAPRSSQLDNTHSPVATLRRSVSRPFQLSLSLNFTGSHGDEAPSPRFLAGKEDYIGLAGEVDWRLVVLENNDLSVLEFGCDRAVEGLLDAHRKLLFARIWLP